MTNVSDLRVIKTKRAIREALAKLLAEKDLNQITIKEISDTAEINRKTFYNHYSGIHQLVDEIENELIEKFNTALNKLDLSKDLKNPHAVYKQIFHIFVKEINPRAHIEKFGFYTSLTDKIAEAIKISLLSVFSQKLDVDKTVLKIAIEYWVSGMLAVFEFWYKENSKVSIDKINDTMSILSSNGLCGLLN